MTNKLTQDQLNRLSEYLLGTCSDTESGLNAIGLDSDDFSSDEITDIEADMEGLPSPIEKCPECGWWCECGELIDENGEVVGCDGCFPKTNQ